MGNKIKIKKRTRAWKKQLIARCALMSEQKRLNNANKRGVDLENADSNILKQAAAAAAVAASSAVPKPEQIILVQNSEPSTSGNHKVEIKIEFDDDNLTEVQQPVTVKTENYEDDEDALVNEEEGEMEVAIFQGVDTTGNFTVDIVANGAWGLQKSSSTKPRGKHF